MKAIVYYRYGSPDVVKLQEVAKPVVADDGVLVRVRAAAVNPYDWHFVRGEPYFMRLIAGLRAPKRTGLGVDFAGEVESVGKDVTQFQPGDEVYGMADGAFAEYLSAPQSAIARKPTNLSFEQAAAVPLAALTALQGLRDSGALQAGQRVLIIGASGGIGTFAVQIAKEMGAHVTGLCSTPNVELVRSLGADEVIDYTRQDFTQSGQKFDLILQLGGTDSPARCRRALTSQGKLVLSSGDSKGRWIGPLDRIIKASLMAPFVSQTLVVLGTKRSQPDLDYLREMIEAGKLTTVIDRIQPLSEVPDAIRYVEKAHSRGKVVITI